MRALTLTVAVMLLMTVAPAADADARWSRPLPLPSVGPSAFPLTGALDDHGRAVAGYPTDHGARVIRIGLRSIGRPVAVPGADRVDALTLLAGGTAVGVGTRALPGPGPGPPECCEAPVVFRWPARGGAFAVQDPPPPLSTANWSPDAIAVAPDGTVTLLAGFADSFSFYDPIWEAVVTSRPGDAALAVVRDPFRVASATRPAARALSGGRAALAWRGRRELHVLVLRDGTPVGGRTIPAAPAAEEEELALDGRGRVARLGGVGGRLVLWAEGRGRHLIARRHAYPDTYALAAGPHGEVAVAFTDGGRLRLTTLDGRGHQHGPVLLGRTAGGDQDLPLASYDALGGLHVAWALRGGGVAVHGPDGTHRIPGRRGVEVTDLAVAPGGAELVLWEAGTHAYAARSAP